MEFRIADILDTVDASDISVQPRNVVSGYRIEELVFEKIGHCQIQRHTVQKSVRMGPLVAVLIVLLSLSMIVGASELQVADLFGDFFGILSPGQENTMNEISMIQGNGLPISVSANGTTVTLQAAIGDERSSLRRRTGIYPFRRITAVCLKFWKRIIMKRPTALVFCPINMGNDCIVTTTSPG